MVGRLWHGAIASRHDFMSEPCDLCNVNEWVRIKFGKFVCLTCEPPLDGFPTFYETVTLHPAPGVTEKMKKAEINEIKRHRMLPYERPGGGYYAGRLGDNGKIQEKELKT